MTREEFFAFHDQFCETLKDITISKNNDYTGATVDPFSNFKIVESFGAVTTEQGFFTRMSDKMSRIASFIKNGTLMVKDESVSDSLMDLANYCILFAGYLESKRSQG